MKKASLQILAVLAALTLVCSLGLAAQNEPFLQGFQVSDGHLRIFSALGEGDYQVTLDGQPLSVETVSAAESAVPVMVYCLADVSGSMNNAQMEQVRETLATISASLGDGDGMIISSLGNSAVSSGLLSTAKEREEAITALIQGNEDTNLYAGIVESLRQLQANAAFPPRKCLIVLSDGMDCQDTGYTEQEVLTAIQTADLPVYTIATLRQNPGEAQKEAAKHLGSFARTSAGGLHCAPVLEQLSASEAGKQIWDSLSGGTMLDADLQGLDFGTDKSELLLRVTWRSGDMQLEDTRILYTEDLPFLETKPETESLKETESSTEAESLTAEETEPVPGPHFDFSFPWLIVALAVVAAAAGGIAVVLLHRRKKVARKACENDAAQESIPETAPATRPDFRTEPILPGAPEPSCTVVLTSLGQGKIVCRIPLPDRRPITLGRDPSRSVVLDPSDTRLSGSHCQLLREGKKFFVMDSNSTNGSFLNGVPIKGKGWMPVSEGETLRVGSYEYRLQFRFDDESTG